MKPVASSSSSTECLAEFAQPTKEIPTNYKFQGKSARILDFAATFTYLEPYVEPYVVE